MICSSTDEVHGDGDDGGSCGESWQPPVGPGHVEMGVLERLLGAAHVLVEAGDHLHEGRGELVSSRGPVCKVFINPSSLVGFELRFWQYFQNFSIKYGHFFINYGPIEILNQTSSTNEPIPAGGGVVALQNVDELAGPVLDEVKVLPADGADLEHVAEEVSGGLEARFNKKIVLGLLEK